MNMQTWDWSFKKSEEAVRGYVQAVDLRDAVSRIMTSELPSGELFGQKHQVPIDFLQDAPGNVGPHLEIERGGISLRLNKVVCPSHSRSPTDLVGCGSSNISGPDWEGWFDCCDCGLSFDPQKAIL